MQVGILYKSAIFAYCKLQKMVGMLKVMLTEKKDYDMMYMLGQLSEWTQILHISPQIRGFLSTSPWKRFKMRK